MKITCEKCGYEVQIEDSILLQGALDFSCPSCQNGIKIPRTSAYKEPGQTELDEIGETAVFPKKMLDGPEEDETVIKGKEKEITIDRIADEVSKSGSEITSAPSHSSIVSKTDMDDEQSTGPGREISMISSHKTELDRESEAETVLKKDLLEPKASEKTPFEAGFDKTEPSRKISLQVYRTSLISDYIKPLTDRRNLEKYLPLLAGLIFLIYLLIPGRGKISSPPPVQEDASLSQVLSKASLYYAIDTYDSLDQAGRILKDARSKYPANPEIEGMLAKIYAYFGRATSNREMLRKSIELGVETLSQDPANTDALKSLAIYYSENPEIALKFLNKIYGSQNRSQKISKPDPELLFIEAIIEYTLGNTEKSISKLEQSVSADPNFLRPLKYLRQMYISLNNPEKSLALETTIALVREKYYSQAPELKPEPDESAATTPAPVTTVQPEKTPTPVEAMQTSKPAENKKIALYERKYLKALDLSLKSKYVDSERELISAVDAYKKTPPKERSTKLLSVILMELGQVRIKLYKTDGALTAFKEAIRFNTANAEAHKGLATIYEDLGENRQALKAYKNYLKHNPKALDASDIAAKIQGMERNR